ncbi:MULTISPECIES: hypothetical protein [unclassified Janthinobacterium]|uniref:hypothetical protein n=1 Tax=unclassified Janthinobacterium TaxID=2610881 RepID=UPI0012F990A1|nr:MULTISPECIES: hypothetical protein [unclassified Janthinobacterium]MEC5160342.1 hypothetical protein [Janthinobacterium sp. CG_S6]
MRTSFWLPLLVLVAPLSEASELGRCRFDQADLQFSGAPREQASCLLRHVAKWGKVQPGAATLPAPLDAIIGKPVNTLRADLGRYLVATKMSENEIGGSLDAELSRGRDGAASAPVARYFVIHDTSWPLYANAKKFPGDKTAELNALDRYAGPESVAHVFVDRLGNTLQGHDFGIPWRGTKLENDVVGEPAKGMFLHVELLQPRRRDASVNRNNDAIAPKPGFTAAQYEKLALLYAAASARSGVFMIPAFHAALDEGIPDGHDDPQNFELRRFAGAVASLLKRLRLGGIANATAP